MAILVSIGAFLSTLVGGLVALRARDRLHLILGFSAGVLLGVVAFDLLPEVFALSRGSGHDPATVLLAFAGGFLALHVLERSVLMHGAHEGEYARHRHPTVGVVSALALVAHSFLDGVAIGAGFQVGGATGVVVAAAVVAHDFCDGLNTVSVMRIHDGRGSRARLMLVLEALAPVAGASLTAFVVFPSVALSAYLAFFAGFLLYIATSDILPEAHAQHPSRLTLVATVGGTVLIWLVLSVSR